MDASLSHLFSVFIFIHICLVDARNISQSGGPREWHMFSSRLVPAADDYGSIYLMQLVIRFVCLFSTAMPVIVISRSYFKVSEEASRIYRSVSNYEELNKIIITLKIATE